MYNDRNAYTGHSDIQTDSKLRIQTFLTVVWGFVTLVGNKTLNVNEILAHMLNNI